MRNSHALKCGECQQEGVRGTRRNKADSHKGERPGKSEAHGEILRDRETHKRREGRDRRTEGQKERAKERLTDRETDTEGGEREGHTQRRRKGEPCRVHTMTPSS